MVDTTTMTMEEYTKNMCESGSGLVLPTIPNTINFELNGHILYPLKYILSYGKDHEDAYTHIDEVNDIADYFNILNVPRETVLLRMLPVTIKGTIKDLLKSLPPGTITTLAQMCEEFIHQFFPPKKVAKLKMAISNFKQNAGGIII